VDSHTNTGETTTVASAPTLASVRWVPVKAMLEISSEIVKPTPAQEPAESSAGPLR
jgi:hypothetical protein